MDRVPAAGEATVLQIFINDPWLVVCVLIAVVILGCVAIVFVTDYLRKARQAEIDAALKQDMLNRGLTAVDIKTILEASSDAEMLRQASCGSDHVRVGLGSFRVEVGGKPDPQPAQ